MTDSASLLALLGAAVSARTVEDFNSVRDRLVAAGASYERPIGDLPYNLTVISAQGDREHLLFEGVTNGIDALLALYASRRRLAGEAVPTSPRGLATAEGFPTDEARTQEIARAVSMTLRDSGDDDRPTVVYRDQGIGLGGDAVRRTILGLGQGAKDDKPYLMGSFHKGGATLHRESRGCILLGRPSRELLAEEGGADHVWVTVAYAVWEGGKAERWVYRTDGPWDPDDPRGSGSVLTITDPAVVSRFEPGIHVTHIGYNAPSLAKHTKAKMDRRSLWVVGNTRLFHPVLPWSYVDERDAAGETERMYGRRRNFDSGSPTQLLGSPIVATLNVMDPGSHEAVAVPITCWLFEKDARRNATAERHALVFTLNGQVHAQWDPVELRERTADAQGAATGLRRVAESAIFVEAELDGLPPRRRSKVVSPDRTHLTDDAAATAIQDAVADFLATNDALLELERELAVAASRGGRARGVSSALLDEIARKLGLPGTGGSDASQGRRGERAPEPVLLGEPTELAGPQTVALVADESRVVGFSLNAIDDFIPRYTNDVALEIDGLDLAATPEPSSLRRGRFSLSLLAGREQPEGVYAAEVFVGWLSRAGGSKQLTWPLKVEFRHVRPETGDPGDVGRGSRPVVVLDPDGPTDSPGEVHDTLTGNFVADMYEDAEYARGAGDRRVLLIAISENFEPWQKYREKLAANHHDATVTRRTNRYIVGAAVALGALFGVRGHHRESVKLSDEQRDHAASVAAHAVIASLGEEE